MIKIKRAYEDASPDDGHRFLVDRLWPRGIKKEDLDVEEWYKNVSPSNELRHWFGHDPEKWDEFRRRYDAALDAEPETWQPLLKAARKGTITLVYSAKDEMRNNAVALKEYLERHL